MLRFGNMLLSSTIGTAVDTRLINQRFSDERGFSESCNRRFPGPACGLPQRHATTDGNQLPIPPAIAQPHLHLDARTLMVEVVEVNDIEELSQYRLLWNSLFAAHAERVVLSTSIGSKPTGVTSATIRSCVLIVYAAGEPIGILPLCVRSEQYRVSNVSACSPIRSTTGAPGTARSGRTRRPRCWPPCSTSAARRATGT